VAQYAMIWYGRSQNGSLHLSKVAISADGEAYVNPVSDLRIIDMYITRSKLAVTAATDDVQLNISKL